MNNDSKTISANEINKYMYCPYQWYYERYYGSKFLREQYRERNKEYGYEDSMASNFNKGLNFHNHFYRKDKFIRALKTAFYIAIMAVGAVCGLLFYIHFM